ncbi:MAG TPA: hypothetical protein VK880_02755 [Anaerolineales bacterium]|nr:hypothetical protein [Anaerolineales bacterium]
MNIDVDRLRASTCPAIQYRIRKEILHYPSDLPEMIALQNQILQDEPVQKVFTSQGPDGWLAWNFHGYYSMESGIRLLCEKGLEANQPVLAHALLALEKHTDRLARGLSKVGKIFDDHGFGGAETIRAHLFVHAGNEEISLVQKQIEQALQVFKSATQVKSLESLYEVHKGKFVFREGACWPSIYHLRLLALSQGWRTPENRKMIGKSIRQLVRLSPIPDIYVRHKSQLIAPASFCMHDFTPDMKKLTDAGWMQWFHRMELLARLGVADQIPELKRQLQTLAEILQEGQGLFTNKLNHAYFQKWGAYTGLALEKDWRLPQRRINDLTFRSLLISHYAKQ